MGLAGRDEARDAKSNLVSLRRYDTVHVTLWKVSGANVILCDRFLNLFQLRVLIEMKTATRKTTDKPKSDFDKDRRRKHHHYLVTVHYADAEKFGRVYTDKDKATRFAERQRRSPVVKSARVSQVS